MEESHISLEGVKDAPRTPVGVFRQLGPGIIMAGCIVGSGELIATTSVGGKAGFSLLWMIIIGSLVKFWVQVELGRHAIHSQESTMDAINELKIARFSVFGYSFSLLTISLGTLVLLSMFMQSAILSGVGQTLSLAFTFTDAGKNHNSYMSGDVQWRIAGIEGYNSCDDEENTINSIYNRMLENDLEILRSYSIPIEDAIREGAKKFQVQYSAKKELQKIPKDGGDPWQFDLTTSDERLTAVMNSINPCDGNMTSVYIHLAANQGVGIDSILWCAIVVAISIPIFLSGKYALVETVATVLLTLFSIICVISIILIQQHPVWHVTLAEFLSGLTFQLPEEQPMESLSLAMSAFGLIGAGAGELVAYSYWLLEKGYARNVGVRPGPSLEQLELSVKTDLDDSSEDEEVSNWNKRAREWTRIMTLDILCSTIAFTLSTIIFYILGAAVLHKTGLVPEGSEMIRYLTTMFGPSFGRFAVSLFLMGSFAILYSSFFLGTLINCKMVCDIARNLKLLPPKRVVIVRRIFCVVYPIFLLISGYIPNYDPKFLVLLVGALATVFLPVIGGAALMFRFKQCPHALKPSRVWDVMLIISVALLTFTSLFTLYLKFAV